MNTSTERQFNVFQAVAMCFVVMSISVGGVYALMSDSKMHTAHPTTINASIEITYEAIYAANPTHIDIAGAEFAASPNRPNRHFRLATANNVRHASDLSLEHQNAQGQTVRHCGLSKLEPRPFGNSVLVSLSNVAHADAASTAACLATTLAFAKQMSQARTQAIAELERLHQP